MKHTAPALVLALSIVFLPAIKNCFGQAVHPSPNAAVEYWRAGYWLTTSSADVKGGLSPLNEIDWSAIGSNLDPDQMPPAYRAAVSLISPEAVEDFLLAASRARCDFQVSLDKGHQSTLPHLGILRTVARAVRLDARERLVSGDGQAAAERIAALFASGGHISQDGVLISSLVGAAISNSAAEELKVLIASGRLQEIGKTTILKALETLSGEDPFQFRSAISGEREMLVGWIRRTFQGPDAGKRFAAELGPLLGEAKDDGRLLEIESMTAQQFAESLQQIDGYYDQLLRAWNAEDPAQEFAAADRAAKAGEYGVMAKLLAPAMVKAYQSARRAREARDEAVALLRSYIPPEETSRPGGR